jgi:DNA repair exonuclease SbcCD nuclease subunit
MKFCILGDTHFGLRNDSVAFNDLARKFYSETFIPYLKEHKIKTVIQLGDLFDRRKYINFNSLAQAKEYFFDPLAEAKITLFTLIGNHDIFYRNTLKVNSTSLVLGEYDNVRIISEPISAIIHGLQVDIIPWICEENEKEIMDFVANTSSDICFSHLELSGFEMDRGNWCHEGMDSVRFNRYEQVISGHFHHKSQKGNILYAGAPMEMTWADWNDPKGFHIFDTKTREMKFIQNPHTIYTKINYDDDDLYLDEVQSKDFSEYTGKYVKVIVIKKGNAFLFETFMDNLNKANPIDVTIVEDFTDSDTPLNAEDINQADDTMSIIDKVVDGLEIDLQKPRLKSILRQVYTEASIIE